MAKILYISDSSIPSYSANSIHVMKMCQALAKAGHQVTLLGKNTRACVKDVKDIFGFYGVSSSFRIVIFPKASTKGSGRWYNLMLWRFIDSRYDLRYTRSIYAALWCWILRQYIAFEVHEPFEGKGFFLSFFFSRIIRSTKIVKVIVISDALKLYLRQRYHLDDSKIVVAHDGADPLEPLISNLELPGKNRLKVGYVGSLLKGKGAELIVALARVCPDVDFHIVGGTISEIKSINALNGDQSDNLFFHGSVPHAKTGAYIQSFSILLAPYQPKIFVKLNRRANNIAQWMSPLKLFEYMSSLRPMIVSDLPVIREVLKHEKNALLCHPERLNDWVAAIRTLEKDPALRERISQEAFQNFVTHYTWEKRAQRILSLLEVA